MPLTSQSTLVEPMRSLMELARQLQQSPLLSVCLMPGFPAADVADCGPAAYACGYSEEAAREAAASIAREVRAREREFALELYSIEQAIAEIDAACRAARPADHPRRHPGQPGRWRQRGHDEPDQGPRRFQPARRARRRDL